MSLDEHFRQPPARALTGVRGQVEADLSALAHELAQQAAGLSLPRPVARGSQASPGADYFEQELVRTLADGDRSLLGRVQ